MDSMKGRPIVALVFVALAALPLPAFAQASWDASIDEASARFGIPSAWIRRVIEVESAGQVSLSGRPIRSRVGAMGLMQLMPGTWAAMRRAHGLGSNPDDPRDNILAGTAYLRAMYDRFGYPGLFAAYNAGPARYADHLARGTRLPGETVAYLARTAGPHNTSGPGTAAPDPAPHGRNSEGLMIQLSGEPGSAGAAGAPRRASVFFELDKADTQ